MTKADLIRRLELADDDAEIVFIDEETDSELSVQDIFTGVDEYISIYVKQVS